MIEYELINVNYYTALFAADGDEMTMSSYTMPTSAWTKAGKPNKIKIKVTIDD